MNSDHLWVGFFLCSEVFLAFTYCDEKELAVTPAVLYKKSFLFPSINIVLFVL